MFLLGDDFINSKKLSNDIMLLFVYKVQLDILAQHVIAPYYTSR